MGIQMGFWIPGGTLALALMLLLDATVGNLLLQEFSALTKCITKAFCVARSAENSGDLGRSREISGDLRWFPES